MNNPKYTINKNENGDYFWTLTATNGQIIAHSPPYLSLSATINGINSNQQSGQTQKIDKNYE